MPTDFIPPKDADLTTWSANFNTLITATPTAFGLVAGDATAYATLNTAWASAIAAAINPATRTPVTVAAKDTARAALVAKARELAVKVQATPAVTNAQKTSLGLTPRGSTPTPIPAPVTKPVPLVVQYLPLQHVLQIRDVTTPSSRAKPFGAISAQVWGKIGTTPPASINDCVFLGTYTKPFLTLTFAGADAGKTVYYISRWQTRKGLTGPTSDVASATITAA
jgi:hypothetical protein